MTRLSASVPRLRANRVPDGHTTHHRRKSVQKSEKTIREVSSKQATGPGWHGLDAVQNSGKAVQSSISSARSLPCPRFCSPGCLQVRRGPDWGMEGMHARPLLRVYRCPALWGASQNRIHVQIPSWLCLPPQLALSPEAKGPRAVVSQRSCATPQRNQSGYPLYFARRRVVECSFEIKRPKL